MKYEKIIYGQFIKRINRFIALVNVNETIEQVHIKNTGRLIDLLQPNVVVILEVGDNPNRKTRYSLIAVIKDNKIVNVDSQAPNKVAYEAAKSGKILEIGKVDCIRREITFLGSRFDLYYENEKEKGFIEVKGITLEQNGFAMFPDAPTSRGTKHVLELIKSVDEGYKSSILFIIQMKGCHCFTPNKKMDAAFTDALIKASCNGVQILAYDSIVTEDSLILDKPIPIKY